MSESNNHLTPVTIRQTVIKYFNESNNQVHDIKVVGKLNITESKEYLKKCNLGIFISKEDLKETFNVDTVALIQLREEQ